MPKPKIAIIPGSTRKTRFADIPLNWIAEKARAHGAFEIEVVDLRDHPLPFFDEVASNAHAPSEDERALRWQKTLEGFDGFIFVVAEYNRAVTGVLKNALDQAYVEWNRKPFAAVAYGSMGGSSALATLRLIGVELQMVPCRNAVHIGGADFFKVHPGMGGSGRIEDIEESIAKSAQAMLDELEWWAKATMAARSG